MKAGLDLTTLLCSKVRYSTCFVQQVSDVYHAGSCALNYRLVQVPENLRRSSEHHGVPTGWFKSKTPAAESKQDLDTYFHSQVKT